jgi:hypothetical protein
MENYYMRKPKRKTHEVRREKPQQPKQEQHQHTRQRRHLENILTTTRTQLFAETQIEEGAKRLLPSSHEISLSAEHTQHTQSSRMPT